MEPGRGRVESDFALYEVTEGMNMPNHLGLDSFATLLVCLVMIAIVVVPFVRIFQKAGRTGWWAVLMLIPIETFLFKPQSHSAFEPIENVIGQRPEHAKRQRSP
jgi:hypothetical protein